MIVISDFLKVDIRVGTIISAKTNDFSNKSSFLLTIDFGDGIGLKKSSAQLNANYTIEGLIDKQIAAVINLEPKQIGKMLSEVLVLGFPDVNNNPVLIFPDFKIKNGGKLF